MNETTNDTTARNLGELTYVRTYDAPRELVYRCMTTPEHLTHFWGPIGVHTPIENITIDLRPGGAFETIMVDAHDGVRLSPLTRPPLRAGSSSSPVRSSPARAPSWRRLGRRGLRG